jgi:hypothetical protein
MFAAHDVAQLGENNEKSCVLFRGELSQKAVLRVVPTYVNRYEVIIQLLRSKAWRSLAIVINAVLIVVISIVIRNRQIHILLTVSEIA